MPEFSVADSATFAGQRALLETTVPRLEEALRGLTWALERKPYLFDKIEQVNGLRMARLEGLPIPGSRETNTVRIYFKLRDDRVTLEWMEVVPTA